MGDGTVLVTGGSGYIGGWCIARLLNDGWQVRTTIRNLARESDVRRALATVAPLLYDLTSTYFESDPPQDEADKRRFSRDKRSDCVQEACGLGEAEVTAEQIGQRALAEPLAAGRNQPVGDQHEQDLLPTRALAAGRQARGEEAVESQLLPQLQGEPAGAPTPCLCRPGPSSPGAFGRFDRGHIRRLRA